MSISICTSIITPKFPFSRCQLGSAGSDPIQVVGGLGYGIWSSRRANGASSYENRVLKVHKFLSREAVPYRQGAICAPCIPIARFVPFSPPLSSGACWTVEVRVAPAVLYLGQRTGDLAWSQGWGNRKGCGCSRCERAVIEV